MLTESLGYFGKIPTHGDFVSRTLPASFIEPWDTWLQEALATSQHQLGSEWLDCYLTSPIYRYALAPGICGEYGWMGIFMPSVDKVGRYFPLSLACRMPGSVNPLTVLQQQSQWFEQAEALALTSLQEDFSLERFNTSLAKLTPLHPFDAISRHETENVDLSKFQSAWRLSLEQTPAITELLPDFLDHMLKEQFFSYSVWQTLGSERITPSALICQGLPPFEGMAALFDGNWQQWGWAGNYYPSLPFGHQETDDNA